MFGWYTIFRDMKLKLFTFLKIFIGLSYNGGLLHAQTPEHEVSNMSHWHWRGIHAVARPNAPPNLPKGPLFSHKMGHKWGVCVRVGGWGSKSPLFGSKRSTFWGFCTPINLGYRHGSSHEEGCSFLFGSVACNWAQLFGGKELLLSAICQLYFDKMHILMQPSMGTLNSPSSRIVKDSTPSRCRILRYINFGIDES